MRSIVRGVCTTSTHPATRLVLLPGAYQTPEDLLAQGFADRVTRRHDRLQVELVDVEMAHLNDREFLTDLHENVVQPARRAGCAQVWLAGISLGGFIAMDYAASRPGTVDGLCLLAPYLGNRLLLREIAATSGIAAWQPGALADSDEERRIWRFVQQRLLQQGGAAVPSIFLGFGREDRFAQGHELLAATLPPSSVKSIAGGHDWPVWLELWEYFLEMTFHDAG